MTLTELLARAEALVRESASAGDPTTWLGPLAERPGLAHVIDHTILKAEATAADIRRTADEGRALGTATVCVNGVWVATVAHVLQGSPTGVAAVVGFPLGAMHPAAKAAEAARAVADGATELDMVLQLGAALAGDWAMVHDDIAAVVQAAGAVPVKVILEAAALPPLAVAMASLVSVAAGARYVKTSTGFHASGGASVEAVGLMRRAVGPTVGVKASGGVRTAEQALAMLAAGADRIGTSGSAAICAGGGAGLLGALVRTALATSSGGGPSTPGGGYG
jgi:deoxyribose-phosphate aldolase